MNKENPPAAIRISTADMAALRVRIKGPDFLFQSLPARAMALIATLPRGQVQVSIPHQRDPDAGYLIQREFPPAGEGFVLVYAPGPNRDYQAVQTYFQGETFEISRFYAVAARWVETRLGPISELPGRFLYLAPTVEQWGVMLGDSGYVAADPSNLSDNISSAMKLQPDRLASGVVLRIPLYTRGTQPPPPYFSRVELNLDPGEEGRWVSFDEHQRMRTLKSRPPEVIVERFRVWQEQLKLESSFQSWIFSPGMLFSDCVEWWGNCSRRRTIHEGIDFARGRKPDGSVCDIPEGTPVRAMADGETVAALDDFLGKTLVVRHPRIQNEDSELFHTLYSHIQPEKNIEGQVAEGQVLGRIGRPKSAGAPMHLHLTAAWIPRSIRPESLTMNHIHPAFDPIALVDFGVGASTLQIVDRPAPGSGQQR